MANLQASSTNVVTVSFKEALEAEWLRRLEAVKDVNKVDGNTWALETTQPEAVRKAVLQLAVEQNLNVVSLQSGSKRLEEVFRQLTAAKD